MRVVVTDEAWEDCETWADQRKLLLRINRMIDEARRDPGAGVGEPQRLSDDLSGCWSRRTDHEHRPVYTVADGDLVIVQVRYRS